MELSSKPGPWTDDREEVSRRAHAVWRWQFPRIAFCYAYVYTFIATLPGGQRIAKPKDGWSLAEILNDMRA